jgi:DNA-binding response OmpR family regulator
MSNKKIPIVEDDADVRMGFHVRLTPITTIASLPSMLSSALGEARKHEPDLILLDLGLPAGMASW